MGKSKNYLAKVPPIENKIVLNGKNNLKILRKAAREYKLKRKKEKRLKRLQ